MAVRRTAGLVSVTAAIFGNALVTLIKTSAALTSGSSVMFAEAVHSFADTLNQTLLFIGVRRSVKKPSKHFIYGYGHERFFWALLSACGIFFVGAGVTVYRGVLSLLHPEPVEINALIFLVLGASFIIESGTFLIAARELKRSYPDIPWSRRLAIADPTT
ncbi:MAG: cation transporter, partial [Patescibacteria group bacterium]